MKIEKIEISFQVLWSTLGHYAYGVMITRKCSDRES